MNITVVQGAFLPVPPIMGGAVEKVWTALSEEFARRGHVVTHLSRRHPEFPDRQRLEGVEHLRVSGFDAPRSLLLLKVLDLIYSLRAVKRLPPADVLVTNTFWLPILARDRLHGKVYVHIARYPKGQMRFYDRAARLQTVSEPVADAIRREVPLMSAKVRVIPYPLIKNESNQEQGETDTSNRRRILFVGRIHPEKGLHLLIESFSKLSRTQRKDWRLVIVGPAATRFGGGGEDYLESLKKLAQPFSDQVEWVGAVFDAAQLDALYRSAAIFVYPSLAERGETFGLAPLEAMAQGCVPVVSNLACFRDYVEHQRCGIIFDHGNAGVDALTRELAALLADEDRVTRLAAAARTKSNAYELKQIAGRYLEDFASLYDA